MKRTISIFLVFILGIIFCRGSNKILPEIPFLNTRANIPSKATCAENKIEKRICMGEYYNAEGKDTINIMSFDKTGNILSIYFDNNGEVEYLYKDSILVEKIEYNNSNIFTNKYTYLVNIRIDSIYFDSHMYFWTKNFQDEQGRDTLVHIFSETTNWELDGKEIIVYDEYGLKEHIWDYGYKYIREESRINNDLYKHIFKNYYGSKNQDVKTILYNESKFQIEFKVENLEIEDHNIRYKTEYSEKGLALKDVYYNKDNEPIYVLNYTYEYY